MAAIPIAAGPAARRGVEGLILVATITMVAFYYLTRADTIGVMRGGVWYPMTLAPSSAVVHFGWSAVVLGVLPVLAARWGWRIRLTDLGLGLGNWKAGLALFVVALPVAILAGKVGAGSVAVRAVYPLDAELGASGLIGHSLAQVAYFGSWEVLFRGVLLFGLAPRFGAGPANVLQTALSVLAHLGRPLEEIVAAIPAGLLFGAVDLRLRSIWWVAALHWIEGAALNYFILGFGA